MKGEGVPGADCAARGRGGAVHNAVCLRVLGNRIQQVCRLMDTLTAWGVGAASRVHPCQTSAVHLTQTGSLLLFLQKAGQK